MRLLASRAGRHPPGARPCTRSAAKLQPLPMPGGGQLFTAPAVWRRGGRTTMFVADEHGTAAYVLRRGRLHRAWENDTPGTSPVMAGGLLYVYDPDAGGIYVYRPSSAAPIAKLPANPATGTARSSSTATSSSPRATPTPTAHGHARDLLGPLKPASAAEPLQGAPGIGLRQPPGTDGRSSRPRKRVERGALGADERQPALVEVVLQAR